MLVHDLTHTITEDILVWPGTEQPKLSEGSTFERDGFRETRLEIFSHVGTHMDAEGFPRHHLMFENSLVIVENLCNLTEIAGRRVFFAALPLKYKDADGAPVRAVGIED